MKITIDTKHDTHDDIRKVLHILTHILENKETGLSSSYAQESNATLETSSSSASEPADSSNLMSMFANPGENQENSETPPDFSNFMNLVDKKDDDGEKKEPKLEFF